VIELPPPPAALAAYVAPRSEGDPVALYLEQGRHFSEVLMSLIPTDVDLRDGRVLDFGCGSGRILRHLINAGTGAVFEGADIHRPSVDWLHHHLPPPHTAFLTEPLPPVPRPDGHYRLIYAMSVFTHLTDEWAAWICELHRLLADGGVLIATVLGASAGRLFGEAAWDDARVGMLVLGPGNPWEAGGPMVLHSEWWVRAHWGRAFEIVSFDPGENGGQGAVVMRRRDVAPTPGELTEIEPGEGREYTALIHGLRRAHDERILLNTSHDAYAEAYQQEAAARQAAEAGWQAARRRSQELEAELVAARAELARARRPRQAARTLLGALARARRRAGPS
jgi:SAM-dependent methyltransferase